MTNVESDCRSTTRDDRVSMFFLIQEKEQDKRNNDRPTDQPRQNFSKASRLYRLLDEVVGVVVLVEVLREERKIAVPVPHVVHVFLGIGTRGWNPVLKVLENDVKNVHGGVAFCPVIESDGVRSGLEYPQP